MHVESVAWASERKDVLYAFFFLLSLLAYLKYVKTSLTLKWLGIAWLLAICSFLSKPAAMPIPFILVLLDLYQGRSWKSGRLWLEKVPFLLLSIVFGMITVAIQSDDAIRSMDDIKWVEQLSFAAYGMVMYVGKFLTPYPLFHFYPYPTTPIPIYFYFMPLVVILMFFGRLLVGEKNQKRFA